MTEYTYETLLQLHKDDAFMLSFLQQGSTQQYINECIAFYYKEQLQTNSHCKELIENIISRKDNALKNILYLHGNLVEVNNQRKLKTNELLNHQIFDVKNLKKNYESLVNDVRKSNKSFEISNYSLHKLITEYHRIHKGKQYSYKRSYINLRLWQSVLYRMSSDYCVNRNDKPLYTIIDDLGADTTPIYTDIYPISDDIKTRMNFFDDLLNFSKVFYYKPFCNNFEEFCLIAPYLNDTVKTLIKEHSDIVRLLGSKLNFHICGKYQDEIDYYFTDNSIDELDYDSLIAYRDKISDKMQQQLIYQQWIKDKTYLSQH